MRRAGIEPILKMMRRVFLGIFLFLIIQPVIAQVDPAVETSWTSSVDWSQGVLELTAERPIDRSGANVPAAAHRTERQISRELPSALVDALIPLRIDSRRTLGDLLREDPEIYTAIEALSTEVERRVTRPDPALRRLRVRYRLPLFPHLPSILGTEELLLPLRRPLGWSPSTEYTGIVIYAAEPLPIHGTDILSRPVPALKPEIFDESMREVLSEQQVEREWLLKWGTAASSEELDLSSFVERIGEKPKRILARRLFGIAPTDFVISNRDAEGILSNPANRALLREGRILVIIGD